MGLRSGLPNLGRPRRRVAALAAPIQLASAAQQPTIKSAHQPPRSDRGQPVEAPQLGLTTGGMMAFGLLVEALPFILRQARLNGGAIVYHRGRGTVYQGGGRELAAS